MNDLFAPARRRLRGGPGERAVVVLARRPVHAVVALLVHSLSLAALFLILGADMVAMGQVLIYSGAIVVLFLFVVALLPQGGAEGVRHRPDRSAGSSPAARCWPAWRPGSRWPAPLPPAAADAGGNVVEVGRALFGRLLVAFELTAPLLLVAIVGAVAIWRRQERARHEPSRDPGAGDQRRSSWRSGRLAR